MKTHREQPHHGNFLPINTIPSVKQPFDWNRRHPNGNLVTNTTAPKNIKTGSWKTYSAKNPGNKK